MNTGISSPVPSPRAASNGETTPNGHHHQNQQETTSGVNPKQCVVVPEFQMPLHYPRYSKSDYERMPEWKLDRLLSEYGLPTAGDVEHKKSFAMGAFLWPDQLE